MRRFPGRLQVSMSHKPHAWNGRFLTLQRREKVSSSDPSGMRDPLKDRLLDLKSVLSMALAIDQARKEGSLPPRA
jgi:hypothetical protein